MEVAKQITNLEHGSGINDVKVGRTEVRVQGKPMYLPGVDIRGRTVVAHPGSLKIAKIQDEELVEGRLVDEPGAFIAELKSAGLRADLFTFSGAIGAEKPEYSYKTEWDNWAVVPITTFEDWWENRLPQESRKNVRRAAKRGVTVRTVAFDDKLVQGIHAIYNETPVRQGRPFWHYGKPIDAVRRENATYPDRSEFVGAYFNETLIGFIKIIYVGRLATLIQILAANEHQDKRPINALLAKAVEICAQKNVSFLIYGKYVYDNNYASALTEFKRRNGFEEAKYPRYFVPLTLKGNLAVKIGLHRGLKQMLPPGVRTTLLKLRSKFYNRSKSASNTVDD